MAKRKPAKKKTAKKKTATRTRKTATATADEPNFEIDCVRWKNAFQARGIDPEKARNELLRIHRRTGGLTDDAIIEAASSPRNVLHHAFEWDDSIAANEHRRRQARRILQCITICYVERPKEPTRAFEIVRKAPRSQPQTRTLYGTHEEAMKDPVAREQLLADAIRQLMSLRRRFKDLNELDRVMTAIEAVYDEFTEQLEED